MLFATMLAKDKTGAPPRASECLPGRDEALVVSPSHYVNGNAITGPFPDGLKQVQLGMGCFWGAERLFWKLPGVFSTAVGYAGGHTKNATYKEVCSGRTAHTEVVLVVYDPKSITLSAILKTFWENHDPTQGMRQGADVGSQYRSAIYADNDEDLALAKRSAEAYNAELQKASLGHVTTELRSEVQFFYAEDYHQQYLAKNPNGYCGIGGTGVSCPVGVAL